MVAEETKKRILVVEDEGLVAGDVQRQLEKMGFSVPAIASCGRDALRLARSAAPDLVLMDVRLSGDMDGIAAAQTLRDELQTPVVYITAHADQETIDRAMVTEPFGYVLKPIGYDNLRSTVQLALYKHEMEQRVRTSEAWLWTTLRNVGEGIVATDTSGEIVFMNPVAERLTGWTRAEAYHCPLTDVLGLREDNTGQTAKNPIFDLLPGESRTYTLISKSGMKTPVEVDCFENHSSEEVLGAILVVRDIRGRRELEGQQWQSQKMEVIGKMAGGLAHDFDNLLTIIQGYSDQLCSDPPEDPREVARQIKEAASVAGSITSQLLTLSRPTADCPAVVNINELICEVQPLLSHGLGTNRTLTTELCAQEGFVQGDRNQLKQLFLHLALNAKDDMPAGGELRIETSIREIDPGSDAARHYRPGRYVQLQVSDSGEGMDEKTLAHVFEPFFSTKASGSGAGLALSIVHSIIAQNGGYIRAESQNNRGTTFEMMLPCVGTFQGLKGLLEPAKEEGPVPTILLVEDEDGIRRLMHSQLEREGYQLLDARNAEEAELIAKAFQDPINVLVTDIVMPGMSGVQLAECLKRLRPEMKMLFVSGYRHDVLESYGLPNEGADFLSKPYPAHELLRRVRKLGTPEASASERAS